MQEITSPQVRVVRIGIDLPIVGIPGFVEFLREALLIGPEVRVSEVGVEGDQVPLPLLPHDLHGVPEVLGEGRRGHEVLLHVEREGRAHRVLPLVDVVAQPPVLGGGHQPEPVPALQRPDGRQMLGPAPVVRDHDVPEGAAPLPAGTQQPLKGAAAVVVRDQQRDIWKIIGGV